MKESKCLPVILATALLLWGCGLLLYPAMNRAWQERRMYRDAEAFRTFVETRQEPTVPEPEREPDPPEEAIPAVYPELWQAMKDYNEEIFQSGQSEMTSPVPYEKPQHFLFRTMDWKPRRLVFCLFPSWSWKCRCIWGLPKRTWPRVPLYWVRPACP